MKYPALIYYYKETVVNEFQRFLLDPKGSVWIPMDPNELCIKEENLFWIIKCCCEIWVGIEEPVSAEMAVSDCFQ